MPRTLRLAPSFTLLLALACSAPAPGTDTDTDTGGNTDARAARPPTVAAQAWGSRPDPFPDAYVHTPRVVLLHHAGVAWRDGDDPFVKLVNLQTWGKRERGWHDVPYHYLIAPDGRIFEGRALRYRPDTNTRFDTTGYVNVQLWGDLDTQRVTQAQLRATAALCAWLADALDMETSALRTHRDVAPGQTSCPGEDFHRYVADGRFAAWVDALRRGEEAAIPEPGTE